MTARRPPLASSCTSLEHIPVAQSQTDTLPSDGMNGTKNGGLSSIALTEDFTSYCCLTRLFRGLVDGVDE